MRKKAYIAGQLSGLGDIYLAKYRAAEDHLIQNGFNVYRPLPLTLDSHILKVKTRSWMRYTMDCMTELSSKLDVAIALEDWRIHRSVIIELWACEHIGVPIFSIETMKPIKLSNWIKLKVVFNLV